MHLFRNCENENGKIDGLSDERTHSALKEVCQQL
jgi:hypothetical protein